MEKVKLGDVCEIINGYAFKSNLYEENGIRIIRITNVQKGYIEDTEPKFYNLNLKRELNKYMLYEKDLLISLTGNVGRVGILKKEMLPAALNQRVGCIRVLNKSRLDKNYLFNVLNNKLFENECINNSKGIAQKNLSTEWLKEYKINLPSLEEQKNIANKLDKVQKIIDIRKKQIEELDKLIKSQFVEMFGDININDKLWKEDILRNHLKVIGGYAFKSSEFKNSGIPILRIGNINTGYFRPKDLMFWNEEDKLKNYIIYPNDIVMSLTGTVGKDDYGNVCIMGRDYEKYYLNQRNAKLELKDTLDKIYISYALRVPEIKKRLTGISRGVRQANIANKDIENLYIPIPPIELQNQFADIVKQIDKQKFEIQKNLEEMQKLQESLMNKYFG